MCTLNRTIKCFYEIQVILNFLTVLNVSSLYRKYTTNRKSWYYYLFYSTKKNTCQWYKITLEFRQTKDFGNQRKIYRKCLPLILTNVSKIRAYVIGFRDWHTHFPNSEVYTYWTIWRISWHVHPVRNRQTDDGQQTRKGWQTKSRFSVHDAAVTLLLK